VAFGGSGLTRGVVSLERDSVVVYYYLSASEVCPDKRGDLWWEWSYKRGGLS